jgi:TatD DNase family protein
MLTDTHCHLNFDAFDGDRDQVIDRAKGAGVIGIFNPGIDLDSSRQAVRLAESQEIVYAGVGVHPNQARTWNDQVRAELQTLGKHARVVAIGEIGLDYYREGAPREIQRRAFLEQLELATQLELPVVIHNRAATKDVVAILVQWQESLADSRSPLANRPGVLHSFSDPAETSWMALEAGFYLGFTGPITFRKADALRDFLKEAPLDRILIETDSPFLAPQPRRGRRNEPAHVRFIADKIAEVRGMQSSEVARVTRENATRLFEWGVNS